MDDWEKDDFEPAVPGGGTSTTDKWEGEDEDDVKDNWEDEDEEKKEEEQEQKITAYQRPKKKPLAERIAEKAKAREAELEEKQKESKPLTPAEQLAEKIRLQKIQEESDLKLARGLFGVGHAGETKGGIDGMYPETKEQFEEFEKALKNKITFFEGSTLYPEFIEKLIGEIAITLPVDSIKKVGLSLNTLYHEKDRIRKEQAKSKKKKQKATIKQVGKTDDLGLGDGSVDGYYDDDDDFI